MVTSLPRSYPYRKNKLTVIGQGIDTTLFTPGAERKVEVPFILCVGRLSPVKDHITLLRAVAVLKSRWPHPFTVVLLGGPAGVGADAYVNELRKAVVDLSLDGVVRFEDPVPPGKLPQWYRRCAAHVNLTPVGFGDKVAWEAMSCGRPCLVANTDFSETLGRYGAELLFRHRDPIDLAQKLVQLFSKSPHERTQMGLYLRARVEEFHSLDRLGDRILEQIQRFQPGSRKQRPATRVEIAR